MALVCNRYAISFCLVMIQYTSQSKPSTFYTFCKNVILPAYIFKIKQIIKCIILDDTITKPFNFLFILHNSFDDARF